METLLTLPSFLGLNVHPLLKGSSCRSPRGGRTSPPDENLFYLANLLKPSLEEKLVLWPIASSIANLKLCICPRSSCEKSKFGVKTNCLCLFVVWRLTASNFVHCLVKFFPENLISLYKRVHKLNLLKALMR